MTTKNLLSLKTINQSRRPSFCAASLAGMGQGKRKMAKVVIEPKQNRHHQIAKKSPKLSNFTNRCGVAPMAWFSLSCSGEVNK